MAVLKNTGKETRHSLARRVLVSFLLTFILLRTLVYAIMSGKMPASYVFLNGTHIHHFNEGIFMLALIAGFMIFAAPTGRLLAWTALFYGAAIALTFDEFGMWLNLNATYWQRISVDMVFIITTLLLILAYAPPWRLLSKKKVAVLLVVLLAYVIAARAAGNHLRAIYGPDLQKLVLFPAPHSKESTPRGFSLPAAPPRRE